MSKDPRVYLAHISECLQKIEQFTAGGQGRFLQDALVQDAVLRNFEVIGEAAKRLDDSYRAMLGDKLGDKLGDRRDVFLY